MKRISAEAYQALREALAVIVWNKRPFESYLRTTLRDNPELLAGLPFAEPKRVVADMLVDRLAQEEQRYQQAALTLMLEVASMESFPNIQQIKDEEDRTFRLAEAKSAVKRLRDVTERYASLLTERERVQADEDARSAQREAQRKFSDEIDALRLHFLALQDEPDHQARGRAFELLLTSFFALFDMEPRLAYDLDREQIDGSLSFDTDDYVVEARWRKDPVDRGDADIFAAKVRRKGKNAVGLFVSVNGFTKDALDQYREATPFSVMDGTDLYLALDQRVRLDDLLKSKKRHANETGDCYLPASALASV
jgi:hypothetical protein